MGATSIVGALSCQQDSYLQTLNTEVISCEKYVPEEQVGGSKNKKSTDLPKTTKEADSTAQSTWMVEFADSVLFPEGGGQHTDHGSITPIGVAEASIIPVENVQRHGLRCIHYLSKPLEIGTKVIQTVDYTRRWDLMQQHTGQHLLSAIMDDMGLDTLGWSMGQPVEMNYVELPRKPTDAEISLIQLKCNEAIRDNLPVTVEIPKGKDAPKLPEDYDGEKGVVRFIKIGDLDYNACCGTHLKQTSHIGTILLHHTQTIRGTNCRLFFTAGDRAIRLATESINGLRNIGISLSTGSTPDDVAQKISVLNDQLAETRRQGKRMALELAQHEARRIKESLERATGVFLHRPNDGPDFINRVLIEIGDAPTSNGVVLLCTGEVRTAGAIVIYGKTELVAALSAKVKDIVQSVKGGGKGAKWQGKVTEWRKGEVEALKSAAEDL